MRLFDTHCHIGLINSDRIQQLLAVQYAKRAGVRHFVSICNSLNDFEVTYNNLRSAADVYHAAGVSPTETGNRIDGWESKLTDFLKLDRVIAVGETGLDYKKNFSPKQTQVDFFMKHLEIARKADLPVIIHNRDAGQDILDILRHNIPDKGAVFHCYSENWNYAKSALDLPVYFSFAGNVTFNNMKSLVETVKNLPADRILIESEAPFMTPRKFTSSNPRIKVRNRLEYIVETMNEIAEIRDTSVEELSEIIYQNSLRAFHLPAEE